jgi:predicted DCC family thiol-disulfide oxidoreductase YuxK
MNRPNLAVFANGDYAGFMRWVLFIDSDCAFCSAWARRVCRADAQQHIFLAALSGRMSTRLGLARHARPDDATVVLLRESDGARFLRSDAVIELGRAIGGWWRMLVLLRWIPSRLRDAAYRIVANHRQCLSRSAAACRIDDPLVRSRMIDDPESQTLNPSFAP